MDPSLNSLLPRSVLIAGCGDVGRRAARLLVAAGREVTGWVRSPPTAQALEGQGVTSALVDLDRPVAPFDPPGLVLYLAPPPATGATDPRLRAFLAALRSQPRRLVYVSTSGVYGDCAGRWVGEDEPLNPQTDRARRRLDAERALQESGLDTVVLRVPGIYGPGRLPVERLRQRLPVIRAGEAPPGNRIHADDLARALLHAAAFGRRGAAYNVSDGHPTTMTDYFIRCARALGLPEPPQVTLEEARRAFTPAMWSFVEESRRLRVERMREELRFEPQYPDLESGLAASLQERPLAAI